MRWRLFFTAICLISIAVIFTGFSSAQVCSGNGDDQLIFKISGTSNAHAEIWDQPNYAGAGSEVCFNNFYDGVYSGVDSQEASSGEGNIVVKLSGVTNAHLEGHEENNYPEKIFYGDLHCELRTIIEGCGGISNNGHLATFLGSLSGETNAHFSRGGGGPYLLCCASASTDPNSGGANCGNGNIDDGEQCDGTNLGDYGDCSDLDIPGEEYVGDLVCTSSCKYDLDACQDATTLSNFVVNSCTDGSGHVQIKINDDVIADTSTLTCNDINDIIGGDIPGAFTGGLEEYKRRVCEECTSFIPPTKLCDSSANPDECIDAYCTWDVVRSMCETEYVNFEGSICEVEVLSSSEECLPGQLFRNIQIKDSCADCPPEGCTTQIACPRVVQLPFFSFWNLIITLMIVGAIYGIYIRNEKGK